MTTKNIQDVVTERVEDFRDSVYGNDDALFDRGGNNVSRQVENWLTTTLTQLVKEVEAGERHKIKLRIDYDRRKGIPPEETVTDIYDSIELKETTPPTSDVIEK